MLGLVGPWYLCLLTLFAVILQGCTSLPTQQLAEVEVVGPTWYPQHLVTLNTTNTTDRFGTAASVSGNYALVGAAYDAPMGDARGAAYVFAWDGAGWVVDDVWSPDEVQSGGLFGFSVAISGSLALVGAPEAGSPNTGMAFLYHHSGSNWSRSTFVASPGTLSDAFGYSVAISEPLTLALVGMPDQYHSGTNRAGEVYVYTPDAGVGGAWSQVALLQQPDAEYNDFFGNAVELHGEVRALVSILLLLHLSVCDGFLPPSMHRPLSLLPTVTTTIRARCSCSIPQYLARTPRGRTQQR